MHGSCLRPLPLVALVRSSEDPVEARRGDLEIVGVPLESDGNPERLPRWFYPISGDLKVGGGFQFEGNASGEIRRCDRPTWLQVTFGGPDSFLDVRLAETGDRTTVELTHTVPLAMAGSGAGALFVGPVWDGALLGLGIHLRGLSVGDPLEAANSPEVIEFNRGSISRWTEAVETSGTATAEEMAGAREAAVAQYTTAPS